MITPINVTEGQTTNDVYFKCEGCNLYGILHFEDITIEANQEDFEHLNLCCMRCGAFFQ